MGYGGYNWRGLWLFALRRAAFGDACAVYCLCRAELQALQGGGREEAGAAAKLFAVLLLADEAFKQIGLQIGGNFNWDYLPLHLCSINIFLIALHAWKPNRLLDNFLYFICIPAATAALLFPTWTSLPATNFMFWHSTSVHILLAAYPIMLFSGGEIRPSVRYMGKCFLLLLAMAVPIYCVNLLLDTNFMFLMYAPDGNPLAWFRDRFGYHWIGFPVLLAAVFALMDVPVLLKGRQENKAIRAAE